LKIFRDREVYWNSSSVENLSSSGSLLELQ
jgi:hypothetical protein